MTHTPGPWLWRWKDNSLRRAGDGKPYEYTAEVVLRLAEDAEVSDADDRLIAAAPDMLAALILARGHLGDGFYHSEAREAVDFAIAKATGE